MHATNLEAEKRKRRKGGAVEGRAAKARLDRRASGGGVTRSTFNAAINDNPARPTFDEPNALPAVHVRKRGGVVKRANGGSADEAMDEARQQSDAYTRNSTLRSMSTSGGMPVMVRGKDGGVDQDATRRLRMNNSRLGLAEAVNLKKGTYDTPQSIRRDYPDPDTYLARDVANRTSQAIDPKGEKGGFAKGGRLNAATRNALPAKDFAGPDRSYPIENASHARNALARVSQHGGKELQAKVRAKVHARFPGIGKS